LIPYGPLPNGSMKVTFLQWQYEGDIPPEYLFPKNIDIPAFDDDMALSHETSPDDQLAPDHLKDIFFYPMSPGEHHTSPALPTPTETNGESREPPISTFPSQFGASTTQPTMPRATNEPPAIHLTLRNGETNAPPPHYPGASIEPPANQHSNFPGASIEATSSKPTL